MSSETALFAVFVRSIGRVGRTTDTLRYLYAASPLQRLLQFYSEHHTMAMLLGVGSCPAVIFFHFKPAPQCQKMGWEASGAP